MNENPAQKCRTCLKNSARTYSLAKQAAGCKPKRTYGQLLMEYAKIECTTDIDLLMPQYLCLLCCRSLRNACAFIKQAQSCNKKLINVISKQLNCLKEKTIDLPENANELENFNRDIKIEENINEDCHTEVSIAQDSKIDVQLKVSEIKHKSFKNDENEDMEIIDSYQNYLNDLPLECSLVVDDTKTATTLLNCSEEPSKEIQIVTVCPICDKNMSGCDSLIVHMRTQHDIEDPSKLLPKKVNPKPIEVFCCSLCSCNYTNKYKYLYHLKHKHGIHETKAKQNKKDKIIKCRSCDYTARTYAALSYHTRSKHGTEKDKFKCKFCSHMCLKKFDLLTHVKNYHKELIKTLKAKAESKGDLGKEIPNDAATLNYENLSTSKMSAMQEDNSVDVSENSSSDDDTPLAQIRKPNNLSLNTDLEEDKEQFSDEEFIRSILNIKKRNIKPSSKSLARRCDECGNIYKNYKALYAHQKHVHISEDKYSLCPHCGKKYKRKADLRIHIEKTHIPKDPNAAKQPAKVREKRFMCTECSYVCTTITILNIHINRHHTGEKPYKCDICFKSFIVPFDLKTHRYLHTGERPYKCPICLKGFRDNSHMIKHKRIHSTERPYKCIECGKSFTQSYNLSVHKRTHLKENKLNCAVCGKVFENRSLLNLHRINEDHHDDV